MYFAGKLLLLTALGIFTAGCSPSNGPTDHSNAGSPAAADASPRGLVATAVGEHLMPLTADELNLARTVSTDSCNIEALGKTAFGSAPLDVTNKSITVSGWVLSAISRKPGVPAQLRVVNMAGTEGWQLPIGSWVARPDVLSTMHSLESGNVGFMQPVDFGALPTGQYHLLVTFQDADQAYSCDKGRVIKTS